MPAPYRDGVPRRFRILGRAAGISGILALTQLVLLVVLLLLLLLLLLGGGGGDQGLVDCAVLQGAKAPAVPHGGGGVSCRGGLL